MPVTPQFSADQNDEFIIVSVRVPYVRVSDAEIDIDGPNLSFWCKPYLLKLTFPFKLIDDDRAKAVYDPSKVVKFYILLHSILNKVSTQHLSLFRLAGLGYSHYIRT